MEYESIPYKLYQPSLLIIDQRIPSRYDIMIDESSYYAKMRGVMKSEK